MSKTRYIKTDFWSDQFIEWLSVEEKLLYIYLFSNEKVDLCGAYEISLKKISFETGISIKNVELAIIEFSKKWKVFYRDWYIFMKNFTKHLTKSPSIDQWIERSKNALPKPIQDLIYTVYTGCIGDGLPIPIPIPIPEPYLDLTDISKDIWEQALEVSDTTEIQDYGNTGINDMQKFLRQAVGLDSFKDKKERWYVTHCYNLLKKIWRDEFQERLKVILSDPFKAKNCNKLEYLYWELKSFIHSPVIEPISSKISKVW